MDNSMADSDAEKTVLELLPKLLKEKPSFRYEVEDILSDRLVVKDEIKSLIQENAREHQALLEKIDKSIEEMHHGFEENAREHREMIQKMDGTLEGMHHLTVKVEGNSTSLGLMAEGFYTKNAMEIFRAEHPGVEVVHRLLDKVVEGRNVDAIITDGEVWVLEVSASISVGDVDRAAERAEVLQHSPEYEGKRVHALVSGARLSESVERYAQKKGVRVIGV